MIHSDDSNRNNSTIEQQNTLHNRFNRDSPVECYKLRIIGVVVVLLFVLCVAFNAILLLAFYRKRGAARAPLNIFIITLTAYNLVGSIFEFPFIIVSNFYCGWIFEESGCIFSGFVMYWVGTTSLYLMAAISIERYNLMKNPLNMKNLETSHAYWIVLLCSVLGLLWAILPMMGWSYYDLEGALVSCSVKWNDRSFNVVSYNVTIFVTTYFLPLAIIFKINFHLILIIHKIKNILRSCNINDKLNRKIILERCSTIIMILIIISLVVAWTPYAIVSLYSAFISTEEIEPILTTLPSIFAKSSMLWPTVLYIWSNRKIRKLIVSQMNVIRDWKKSSSGNQRTGQNIYRIRFANKRNA